MKKFLTTCTALLTVLTLFAQSSAGYWSENHSSDFAKPAFMPLEWRALSLNLNAMRNHLRQAPMELTAAAQNSPLELVLPMPDGTMAAFAIWESPIMEPALAEKFPMIKTYAGKAVSHPETSIRLDISPQGFNAIMHSTGGGTVLIVPNAPEGQVYLSFWLKNVDFNTEEAQQFHCEVEHTQAEIESFTEDFAPANDRAVVPVDRYTYRLAVATTAEYSSSEGGTVSSVMAAVVNVVNNVNSVFERDAAVRLLLVANNDTLFYFSNPDPYTNGNTESMIGQNPAILNAAFTVNGYDMGHVFGTQGGGLAQLGGVCNSEILAQYPKARAASCKFGPYTGALFYIVVGHEMGHQLNATHTFNKCDNENETPETAYEPGSGSSIMCYNGNGVCTVNHLQPTTDDYFHNNSMLRIQAFTRTGGGNQCKQVVPGGNTTPEADIPMQGGFYIPKSTPFSLTGTASDTEDPNTLTYCWEQYDLGPPSTLGSPEGTAPLFRSYPPNATPTRVFPKIQTIISGTPDIQEILPFYDRVLTFRFTVRDNHPNNGGFNYDEIQFNCAASAGPFVETYPNGGETFSVGEYVQVTWDVANTDVAPVNCKKINLYLSTDGGLTYPTLLLSQGDNDGSAYVVMPNMPSTTARIKVEAADNIFFDISNQNFTIAAATQPGYILTTNPAEGGLACNDFTVTLTTQALMGYNGDVTYTVNGLPAGVTANFSANPVAAGQSSTLTVNTSGAATSGNITFNIVATSPGQPDQTRILTIIIVDTDLTGITATAPTDGAAGQGTLPVFGWSALPNAQTYDIQIATDPGFTNIVDSGTGLTSAQFTPSITLEDNQVYYWRVRASNTCGMGDFGDPFSFRTVSQVCTEISSAGDQNSIPIPSTGLPLITSKINFPQAGAISDVRVKKVVATHSALRHIVVRLKSPNGSTPVVLMSEPNCNSNSLNAGFNDQSANILTNCPSANLTYKPVGSLSDFNGQDKKGDWALELEVVNTLGEGGSFSNWALEVCGSVSSASPVVVKNDTLAVPPGGTNRIYTDKLVVNDADNTWGELKFTIVKNTTNGQVKLNGSTLAVGGQFTMDDVFNKYLTYTNTNTAALYDYFTFSVNDGAGGYTGTPHFNIKMDAGAVIIGGTKGQEADAQFQLFPNPATNEVNLVLAPQLGKPLAVQVMDVQGRLVPVAMSGLDTELVQLNTSDVVPGLYFVQVRTAQGVFVRKLVVE
ncbi:MAG: T9SS type A sorting domain-containing protein [Saprospiraceae bacterium]|nr:T9SS type A sorting domain-containing protein [Saprospiraceae bacterium]MCF8250152.1 T9SS type A sorting domain-containing protein [Saprospiraceae bacterium]MCF8279415.1 T9SS type A sorting domain-containing protein [Bacteroidales bacterium]MCF8311206.1 T9SS type A sorting domain-containing protein [Saprospiraceae bacterium]MCF8440414.1 T9SS type A sorting domain-containing protein [Saprospiraceae bacterium]